MALLAFDGFDHYGTDVDLLNRSGTLVWTESENPSGISILYETGRSGNGKCAQLLGGAIGSWLKGTVYADTTQAYYGVAVRMLNTNAQYMDLQIWDDVNQNAPFTFRLFAGSGAVTAYSGDPSTTHKWERILLSGPDVQPPVFEIVDEGPMSFPLATSLPNVFSPTVWNFVEMHVTFDNQTTDTQGNLVDNGTFELKINGASVLSGSGAATYYPTADIGVNRSQFTGWRIKCAPFPGNAPAMQFDDFYVVDQNTGPGSYPLDTYLGDCVVNTTFPTANIAVQWLAIANQNWQEVSQVPFPGDDAYNKTAHDGYTDAFSFGPIPADSNTVLGVQVTAAFRSLNVFGSQLTVTLQSGATTETTDVTAGGAIVQPNYKYFPTLYVLDPNTGADWTVAAVNALTASYTLVS